MCDSRLPDGAGGIVITDIQVAREPDCDGLECYVATPYRLFEMGLLTSDELIQPDRTASWVHRAPCTVVRHLMGRA